MSHKLLDRFYWSDIEVQGYEKLTDAEKYKRIVSWAGKARGQNPLAFDDLTEWLLDDSEWTADKLAENEHILLRGVFARFREQNAKLRALLKELEPSGLVNEAAFKALDWFDNELSGKSQDKRLQDAISQMFANFSIMGDHAIRELIAGEKTGQFGTNGVNLFGYINCLKDGDAQVQWTLFMPDVVKHQQNGFKVESLEYVKMPAMRFIGVEGDHDSITHVDLFKRLDGLRDHKSGFDYDILFMHHYGKAVDVEQWHGFWGRFFKADTPVPDGLIHFDFVPQHDGTSGFPFCSQFAYAAFSGDLEAMHKVEGYDSDAMYDVTRNIMLGQGVNIPYPYKYWTAEVFLKGHEKPSSAYLFSAEL